MSAALDDVGGLSGLYARYGHQVLRRARVLLGNEDDARDLAQEVFTSLVERPEQFSGRSSWSTFLYSATTHLALRRMRDVGNRRRLVSLFVEPAAKDASSAAPGEDLAVLRDLLQRVPAELATVAVYVYVDELSHDEIAGIVGCSRRTVGNLLARFHEQVRIVSRDRVVPAALLATTGRDA